MELIARIGIVFCIGIIVGGVMSRRSAPPAPVVYLKVEPAEKPRKSLAGLSLLLLTLMIIGTIAVSSQ